MSTLPPSHLVPTVTEINWYAMLGIAEEMRKTGCPVVPGALRPKYEAMLAPTNEGEALFLPWGVNRLLGYWQVGRGVCDPLLIPLPLIQNALGKRIKFDEGATLYALCLLFEKGETVEWIDRYRRGESLHLYLANELRVPDVDVARMFFRYFEGAMLDPRLLERFPWLNDLPWQTGIIKDGIRFLLQGVMRTALCRAFEATQEVPSLIHGCEIISEPIHAERVAREINGLQFHVFVTEPQLEPTV